MKKNIGFVNLDSSLVGWLLDKLENAPKEIVGADELCEAISNLADGSSSSLMLEVEEIGEIVSYGDRLQIGELSIYMRARKVVRGNVELSLTPKEFDILYFLARNRGEVFTKEQIYRAVWEGEHLMDDSNIMAFIRKLRKKVEPNPDAPIYILTVWGIGYKFSDSL